MTDPRRALYGYIEALRRAGRHATVSEWREICALHDAATRTPGYHSIGGTSFFDRPVPSLRALEIEFKPIEAEPVNSGGNAQSRRAGSLPDDTEQRLRTEVRKRIDAGMPRTGALTQNMIAKRLNVSNRQVRRVEHDLGGHGH